MEQTSVLSRQWTFICQFCKAEFHDPVAIGVHWRNEHNYTRNNYNLNNEGN